jgi:hypothetical protein
MVLRFKVRTVFTSILNMYLNSRTTGIQRVAAFHSLASQSGGGQATASQSIIGFSRASIASSWQI